MDQRAEERVQLDGLLGEFRDALEAEALAVRSGSGGNAVVLRQGRRILNGAGLHHYRFQVDFPQRLPSDAPAKLVIEGREPVNVTIGEAKGLAVTVVSPDDLGQTIAHASLQTDMSFLLERLVQRIEETADKSNPVGNRVLRRVPPVAGRSSAAVDERYTLLPEQEQALRQALGGDVFIWGPPGTGKTQTIGAIVSELIRGMKSVLLVSHTNSAVDGGLQRAIRNLDLLSEGSGFEEGDIVRVGVCKDRRLQDDADTSRPSVLSRSIAKLRSAEWEEELARLEAAQRAGHDRVSGIRRLLELQEFHELAEPEIAQLKGTLSIVENRAAEVVAASGQVAATAGALLPFERKFAAVEKLRAAERQAADVDSDLAGRRKIHREATTRRELLAHQLSEAQDVLAASEASSRLTRLYKRLPAPEDQSAVVDALRRELAGAESSEEKGRRSCIAASEQLKGHHRDLRAANWILDPDSPEAIVRQTVEARGAASNAEVRLSELRLAHDDLERPLRAQLQERLAVLADEGLVPSSATEGKPRAQLAVLEQCLVDVARELDGFEAPGARAEIEQVGREIDEGRRLADELKGLISRAEEQVITEAKVVATTLTSAYLRDPIVNRTFDVVILDEASMAPIPSLYFAAGLATGSAVVVGDFRQLPPIFISEDEAAERWLGRDVFKVAQVVDYERAGDPPAWFVMLREQKRMRPEISRIVNRFIYGGKLRDGSLASDSEPWVADDWPHKDHRVLLVDLSDSGAWVSRVPSGRHASKVNFYSATGCVDLAGALLAPDREQDGELESPRVAIISRYRPHASLCELLIEHRGLVPDVQAGTAHSFQGAEAETVIIDVVDAPPVWKSGLLRPDEENDPNQRLLNVAVTRAKQRLILVGHFDWVRKNGKRSFLQRVIADLAERHPVVPIEALIPEALHERVAATRGLVVGDRHVDDHHVIADETAYYDLLRQDLGAAKELVVIFSPFLTQQRILDL